MAEDDERPRRQTEHGEYDVSRMLALSDGIFAIAMTLLVLNIPLPPEQLPQHTDAALLAALQHIQGNVFVFALSFVLVGVNWMRHRQLLRGVVRTDGVLVSCNLLMLLLVCVVPFTTGVLSRHGDLPLGASLYAANMALIVTAGLALRARAWTSDLFGRRPEPAEMRGSVIDSLVAAGVFVASIPVAFVSPTAAELLWLVQILTVAVRQRLTVAVRRRLTGARRGAR
jgi:uncharacterized membrane protein